jgi:hypothetical protein
MKPSYGRCFLAVALTRASLKLAGFRRTTGWAQRLSGGRTAAAGDRDQAEQVARKIAIAAAFFPGRAICLEQSIALFVLLRRQGLAAALRIGVQPYPFKAHAWVEVNGEPIYENADELVKFVAFPLSEGVAG